MSQTPPKNYYQMLELENFASLEQVKASFRRLARQYHPDLNAGNKSHEERFKQLNEAYDVLGSTEKKAIYDDALRVTLKVHTIPKKQASAAASQAYSKNAEKPKPKEPVREAPKTPPVSEFFDTVRKAFAQENAGFGASQSKTKPNGKPKRGQDVHVDAYITAEEARDGVVKTVNVQHQDICKRCSGTGKVTGKQCPVCHGEKIVTRLKKIDVKIPSGVKTGSKVRVAAEGARGDQGGDAGDLFLQIHVAPDEHASAKSPTDSVQVDDIRIEGVDAFSELPVSIPDAVLGATVDVKTLHGTLKLTIPPLTSSGRVLRLKEQGAHISGMKGDHYVTIRIMAPENLSARERELYQELAQLHYRKSK